MEESKSDSKKVLVTKNGPYLVTGMVPLGTEIATIGEENQPEFWKRGKEFPLQETYALCRCGNSKNKPYCDGSHNAGFDGAETAKRVEYLKLAEKMIGPGVDLTDAESLCVAGRFCHLSGGTWANVENSDNPSNKAVAIKTACNCPSGRLVAWDKKTGKAIEHAFVPSISLIQDPQAGVSGPLWVKGGIQIESADGHKYEVRNRITLCRCGKSKNKPYCDATHIKAKFNDGDSSAKIIKRKR